jgi:hypothetical protein
MCAEIMFTSVPGLGVELEEEVVSHKVMLYVKIM